MRSRSLHQARQCFRQWSPFFRGRGSRERSSHSARSTATLSGQRRPRRSADTPGTVARASSRRRTIARDFSLASSIFLPFSSFFFSAGLFLGFVAARLASTCPLGEAYFRPSVLSAVRSMSHATRKHFARTGRAERSQCRLTFRTRIAPIERVRGSLRRVRTPRLKASDAHCSRVPIIRVADHTLVE